MGGIYVWDLLEPQMASATRARRACFICRISSKHVLCSLLHKSHSLGRVLWSHQVRDNMLTLQQTAICKVKKRCDLIVRSLCSRIHMCITGQHLQVVRIRSEHWAQLCDLVFSSCDGNHTRGVCGRSDSKPARCLHRQTSIQRPASIHCDYTRLFTGQE